MSDPSTNTVAITVAIATCNRAELLAGALKCLTTQVTDDLFTYEILVIDNGSVDNTREVTLGMDSGNAMAIRFVVEATRGLPFARNRAVTECDTPWLAFFDDDQLASPHWLKTLYQCATDTRVEIVGGARDLLFDVETPVELTAISRQLLGEVSKAERQYYHPKFLPSTGNVLLRRSIFETVGLFDTAVLDGGEDSDFFNRVVAAGIRGFYTPDALVHHIIPEARTQSSYLNWVAFRHGLHVARRDMKQRGMFMSLMLMICRWIQVAGVFVPKKLVSKLTGRVSDEIGTDCRISKTFGFTRYVSSRLGSSNEALVRLQDRSMHRGKR